MTAGGSGRRPSEQRPRPVQLRFISHHLPVELYGDFVHWSAPQPMRQPGGAGAEWEATLHLVPGIYGYKFRTYDGRWHLDPENPRTRATDSGRNNVLVVGGSDEPVLHAATAPLLFLEDDGLLCVRAGLRRGHGERLTLRHFDREQPGPGGQAGDGFRDAVMQLVGEEHEHLLFEARVPMPASALDYLFVLESGRRIGQSGGQALHVKRTELRRPAPKWWREAVLYTVLLDRFRTAQPGQLPAPQLGEQARHGGDLEGVRQALPYLQDLGVTALHLTPVALSHSAHRYDALNPMAVDPALGGEAALRRLLEDAQRRGLRILLDVVLTHVHRDFLPFCEVRTLGQASRYAGWFHIQRHPFFEGPDPGYGHYQKGQWQEPLLRTESEEVAEYLAGVVRHFAQLGVDGFRLDAAADVPLALLERLRAAAVAIRPDAVLFGEITTDNGWRFTAQALDAATDFGHQQALYDWLWHRRIDARLAAQALARRSFQGGPDWARIAFTATHDQPRLQTLVGDPRRARLGQLLTLLGPAIPAIYYGDEQGLHSDDPDRAFEDAWPDRLPMPWPDRMERDARPGDPETHAMVRAALRLRREQAALHRGSTARIELPHCAQVLALRRRAGDELIEIYANGSDGEQRIELPPGPAVATALLTLGAVELTGHTVQLGPFAAAVIRRQAQPEVEAAWQYIREHNRELCTAAFRSGQLAAPCLPTHLYLTITERCNLRCQHCITDAPARTREGRAGTMQPWLLEALAEPLAAADYFGFAHGGESLVAPIFFDVLGRIRELHAGRRYDAHLLSNGMLLDEATVERLCELGLTSLAVSLDGGSAASNDSLRLGADFERILRNLEGTLAVRARRDADLRVGVSTVLTQSNAAELVQLGRRLAALGVDWIKVEELYPVNALSARELLRPRGRRAQEALRELRAVVEPAGLVVVDHLAPPAGCACQSKAEDADALAEFRATDDFANRARFLPCRAAWEQACVDPDGTVRPIDYFQAALGNLAEEPFLSLWQGERAQRVRAQALMRIDSSRRERCSE